MRRLIVALLVVVALGVTANAWGRVGGGQSYSGSSSGSSSGSGSSYSGSSSGRSSYGGSSGSSSGSSYGGSSSGSGDSGGCGQVFIVVLFLLFMVAPFMLLLFRFLREGLRRTPSVVMKARTTAYDLESLRTYDPNFSRIVFEDFCSSLYARVHQARGTGDLARYAPYLSDEVRKSLMKRSPQGLTAVTGIVVGAMEVGWLLGADTPTVSVALRYETNFTEVCGSSQSTWYVRETWMVERARDILSPPPAKARAEHCPRCGAALDTRTDGSCNYCGVKIEDGTFQWFVRSINVLSKEPRGPLLLSDVPEEGTMLPTIRQPGLEERRATFESAHPGFRWDAFTARVRSIATTLQDAWSARNVERIRPLETETLFQTHRYWIDAYLQQHLRNVVTDYSITSLEFARVERDAFYDAITVRLAASGFDHTLDDGGRVVAGSNSRARSWSEYWTLIRSRGTEADPSQTVSCPNCGAAVNVGATGICPHCGGKLAGGDFGWVLSRIEQDEAYRG